MRPVIATRTKGASLAKRRKKAGLNHKICAENADNVNNIKGGKAIGIPV
jgi:hypothetical protein